jgi:shikimate dehydrogenase
MNLPLFYDNSRNSKFGDDPKNQPAEIPDAFLGSLKANPMAAKFVHQRKRNEHQEISRHTAYFRVGLIGSPLKKSFSPELFKTLSSLMGKQFLYTLEETSGHGLKPLLRRIKTEGWAGFNITLPLKEKILPFLDSLSPEARGIGAVNAVRIKNGRLEGYNTDADAVKLALKEAGCRLRGRICVIWGAGGAAKAAAWSLASGGVRAVNIHNRSLSRASRLARHFSAMFPCTTFSARKFAAIPDKSATVLVNATPLGMYGSLPANLKFSGAGGSFYLDFAYALGVTPFLKNRTGRIISGVDLLIYQALKSAKLYGVLPVRVREIVKLKDRIKARLKTAGRPNGKTA